MTQETTHHPAGPLLLAVALAATAGFVDAWIYRNVTPVFVANMSGNLIHLGMDLGGTDWSGVEAALVALGGFVVGVAVATAHLDAQVRAGRAPRPEALLWSESAVLVALTALLWGADVAPVAGIRGWAFVVIPAGAVAMGMQAAALRRVGRIAVATTYGTGSVVRIGEKVTLAARRAANVGEVRRRQTVRVLTAVLVCYVGGAATAVAVGGAHALLLVPAAALAGASVAMRRIGAGTTTAGADPPPLSSR